MLIFKVYITIVHCFSQTYYELNVKLTLILNQQTKILLCTSKYKQQTDYQIINFNLS